MKFTIPVLLGSLLLKLSCSAKDLRSEEMKMQPLRKDDSRTKANQIWQNSLKKRGVQNLKNTNLEIVAVDDWRSTIIRWFTPVKERKQRFKLQMNLRSLHIKFVFLNGVNKPTIIGIKDGQGFEIIGEKEEPNNSSKLKLYLIPLRDYIAWPITLVDLPVQRYQKDTVIDGKSYQVIFMSTGPAENLSTSDHFLVYINSKNGKVDFIDFTMRKLMKSYKGTVIYKDYRPVNGLNMAQRIIIANSIEEAHDFDHQILIKSIKLNLKTENHN